MSKTLLKRMWRQLLGVLALAPAALSAYADGPNVATFGQKDDGPTVSLAEGDYDLSDMNAAGLGNDAIISVKVTPGYKVIGYWDSNFSGDVLEITADCDNLNALKPNWSAAISSLKVVPNGVRGLSGPVRFKNRNSGLFLDAENNSVNGGTLAVQYADGTDASQNWLLKEVADGVYNITSYKSYTQGLDCKDGQTGNGTSIQLVGVTDGNRHQQFIIYDRPGGDYQLVARNSGRVIEIGSSNKASGAKANLYDNNGSDTQQWSLQAPSITELYMVGDIEGINWEPGAPKTADRISDGVFVFRKVTFPKQENEDWRSFQILTGKSWDAVRLLPNAPGTENGNAYLTKDAREASCHWFIPTGAEPSYSIAADTYDITVDLNTHKLSMVPVMPDVHDLFIVGNLYNDSVNIEVVQSRLSGQQSQPMVYFLNYFEMRRFSVSRNNC